MDIKYYSTEWIPVIEQLLYDWLFEIEQSQSSPFPFIHSDFSNKREKKFPSDRMNIYWENYYYWKSQKLNNRQKDWLKNIKSHLNQLNQLLGME